MWSAQKVLVLALIKLALITNTNAFMATHHLPRVLNRGVHTLGHVRGLRAGPIVEGDSVTLIGASSPIGLRLSKLLLEDGRFRVRLIANSPAVCTHDLWTCCRAHYFLLYGSAAEQQ